MDRTIFSPFCDQHARAPARSLLPARPPMKQLLSAFFAAACLLGATVHAQDALPAQK